ncbi:gametogenetin-binding protein 2-like [Hetaerina americana]|uniref:gametogenetin-binding protein 2-like n=1 Tax=Hetaerina americana TaxID=62018 RepID=UPI003A7F280D
MAKLVDVYRGEKITTLCRRQLPLVIDEHLTMVMDLEDPYLESDKPMVRKKELEIFLRKFNLLTPEEQKAAFQVDRKDLMALLSQTVPCVGCRRSVERLFYDLVKSGQGKAALDPVVITPEGMLTLDQQYLQIPHLLCSLLHGHSARLSSLVDSQPRLRKSRRCMLHSLESQRGGGFGGGMGVGTNIMGSARPGVGSVGASGSWLDAWQSLGQVCREELLLIENHTLLSTLEGYLRKHRFCTECRSKVLRAYTLLVEGEGASNAGTNNNSGNTSPSSGGDLKGYQPSLYSGIKRCLPDKHIHLLCNTDFVGHLIGRAEPELVGSRRERHAKTLEMAQEEVLTVVGLCIHRRLSALYHKLRHQQTTVQVLAAVALHALCRSFEMAVEMKQGISQLELLFEELNKEEMAKAQRKEQKRQKKRRKKEARSGRLAERADPEGGRTDGEDEEGEKNADDRDDPCQCDRDGVVLPVSEPMKDCNCSSEENHNVDNKKGHKNRSKDGMTQPCLCPKCEQKERERGARVDRDLIVVGEEPPDKGNGKKGPKVDSGTPAPNHSCRSHYPFNGSLHCRSCQTVHQSSVGKKAVEVKGNNLSKCENGVGSKGKWNGATNNKCNLNEDHSCSGGDCGYSSGGNTHHHHHHHHHHRHNSRDVGSSASCSASMSSSCSLPSSPEGSEVACSDGFCSHEGECNPGEVINEEVRSDPVSWPLGKFGGLTLQQMLEESFSSEEEDEGGSFIPAEEVREFKTRIRHVDQQRQELRQTLKQRFAQLCVSRATANGPSPTPLSPSPHTQWPSLTQCHH